MISSFHIALFLLPFSLPLARITSVNAAASLTPPAESATGTIEPSLSLSFTPLSSTTSGTAAANASATGTATPTSSAQFPSLSGLSSCANQCMGLAISQDGCDSFVDVNCYCANSTQFTSGLVACISAHCPNDLSAAENIAQQFCAVASKSTSLSFPTTVPSTTFSDPFTSYTSASVSASASVSGNSSSTGASASATAPSGTSAAPTASNSSPGNGAEAVGVAGFTGLFGLVLSLAGVALV
ncbi:hypothetical protein C8Q77DRAFT_1220895 [Trametes polyzona]|nr:hypothetical protein C8Q77DRAFT_1220895 [Trametes polyzona]